MAQRGSRIGNGGGGVGDGNIESIPAIQSSDISDTELMEKTKLYKGEGFQPPAPGKVFFRIILPSGKPFACTPFDPAERKQMNGPWLEAARAAFVNDAAEAMEEARAKAGKGRGLGAELLAEMGEEDGYSEGQDTDDGANAEADPAPPQAHRVSGGGRRPNAPNRGANESPPSADPAQFAKDQLKQAMTDLAHAKSVIAEYTAKEKAAEAALTQWKNIVDMFK